MSDRIKNLGTYAHKPKRPVDIGSSEDDMSAKTGVNSKLRPMPQRGQRTTKHKGGGGVRG